MDDYLGSFEENARVRRARRQRELASATQQDGSEASPTPQSGVNVNGKAVSQQDSEFKMPTGSMTGISNLFSTSSEASLGESTIMGGAEGVVDTTGIIGGGEGAGSAAGGAGSGIASAWPIAAIASIVAAISAWESDADDSNKDRWIKDGEFVAPNTDGAERSSDAFSMNFWTDPVSVKNQPNDDPWVTHGEKVDAYTEQGDYWEAVTRLPDAWNEWVYGRVGTQMEDWGLGDSSIWNPAENLIEDVGRSWRNIF